MPVSPSRVILPMVLTADTRESKHTCQALLSHARTGRSPVRSAASAQAVLPDLPAQAGSAGPPRGSTRRT